MLVDFWASWCGPCRQFGPTFQASSEKHPDIVHAKVDTEAEQQLAAAAQIRSIPTLMAFKKGKLRQPGRAVRHQRPWRTWCSKSGSSTSTQPRPGKRKKPDSALPAGQRPATRYLAWVNLVLVDHPRPGVALITLNRPERMNSMAFDVMVPLKAALEEGRLRQFRAGGRADHQGGPRVLLGADHESAGTVPNVDGLTRPTYALRSMELLDDVILMLRRAAPTSDRRGRERAGHRRWTVPGAGRRHPGGLVQRFFRAAGINNGLTASELVLQLPFAPGHRVVTRVRDHADRPRRDRRGSRADRPGVVPGARRTAAGHLLCDRRTDGGLLPAGYRVDQAHTVEWTGRR